MAQILPALAGIGAWLGTAATAAAPYVTVASGLASAGTGIAGAVQAGKKPPDPAAKQRALAERVASERSGRGAIGQQATLLTGASGLTNPANVGKKTLLGG